MVDAPSVPPGTLLWGSPMQTRGPLMSCNSPSSGFCAAARGSELRPSRKLSQGHVAGLAAHLAEGKLLQFQFKTSHMSSPASCKAQTRPTDSLWLLNRMHTAKTQSPRADSSSFCSPEVSNAAELNLESGSQEPWLCWTAPFLIFKRKRIRKVCVGSDL